VARAAADHHRADEADMVHRDYAAGVRHCQGQFGGQAPGRDVDNADVSLRGSKLRTSRTAPHGGPGTILCRWFHLLGGGASAWRQHPQPDRARVLSYFWY
jgi:hypothetical protein